MRGAPQAIQLAWVTAPALSRVVLMSYPATWLLSIFLRDLMKLIYGFTPAELFGPPFKVWSIWTSAFASFPNKSNLIMDLFFMVMILMMLAQEIPQRENNLGSLMTGGWLFFICVYTKLVYMAMAFSLGQLLAVLGLAPEADHWFGPYATSSSGGLWGLYCVMLTVRSCANPSGTSSFFGFVDLPNRKYPLYLMGFFAVLSTLQVLLSGEHVLKVPFYVIGGLMDVTASLGIGYALGYDKISFDFLLKLKPWAEWLESGCLKPLFGRVLPGINARLIGTQESQAIGSPGRGSSRWCDLEATGSAPPEADTEAGAFSFQVGQPEAPKFDMFTGQGHKLGSAEPAVIGSTAG